MSKRIFFLLVAMGVALAAWPQADAAHVRLTNLPHVYINTFTGASVTSKTDYVYARMWYVGEDDAVQDFDSLQIRLRGNSTATLAKKPYKLKFHDKVKLLGKGRPNTKKWTLLANHGDKTMLRNAITSAMGDRAGMAFTPAAKFVDLTFNGTYLGTYQLSDQIDVRPHRVNIAEQPYPLAPTDDISGGYLMEADGFRDFTTMWPPGSSQDMGFYSTQGVPVKIHYPDGDEISQSQVSYITSCINDFEARLFGSSFADAAAGYRPLVDSVSLAQWYLCTEISANIDGFYSAYFYKDKGDARIFFGPLWDYDIAYNNDNRTRQGTNDTERQLMADAGYGLGWGGGNGMWVVRMWDDPWFARLVNREFAALVDGGLEACLNAKLDSLTALIDQSQRLNFQRWGIRQAVLRERVLHSTYAEYVADVRTFINRHLAYLATAFASRLPYTPEPQPEPVEQPDLTIDNDYFYTIQNVNTGTYIDVDVATDNVCCRSWSEVAASQQWRMYNLSNGYVFIRNAATWTAMCDPTPDGATATTQVGAALVVAEADSTDARQQWKVVRQADGIYNLISRSSQHAANLSGGNAADGTPVLSYTSDERNASSANRKWRIAKGRKRDVTTPVADVVTTDYALAYDPVAQRLHFGADDMSQLRFQVTVFDQGGRAVGRFTAAEGYAAAHLPRGIYVVSWQHDGRRRTVKFVR